MKFNRLSSAAIKHAAAAGAGAAAGADERCGASGGQADRGYPLCRAQAVVIALAQA